MIQWAIYGMIYLGSLLMIYNIYGFIRFARYIRARENWGGKMGILYIPVVLLVLFLFGYLAVGFLGKPDLIVSSILFGGSVFVFVMYMLLSQVTEHIIENESLEARVQAAEELHITQPALSRNMKKLETTLGVSLFNRESSKITLNETGKIAAE